MCERITHFCIVAVLFNYFSKIEQPFIVQVFAHTGAIDGDYAVHYLHSAMHTGLLESSHWKVGRSRRGIESKAQ